MKINTNLILTSLVLGAIGMSAPSLAEPPSSPMVGNTPTVAEVPTPETPADAPNVAELPKTPGDDLQTVGDDAQLVVKETPPIPDLAGPSVDQESEKHEYDGKGDNGVFDPGAWGVKKEDIAEGDAWNYQNNPNRMQQGKPPKLHGQGVPKSGSGNVGNPPKPSGPKGQGGGSKPKGTKRGKGSTQSDTPKQTKK